MALQADANIQGSSSRSSSKASNAPADPSGTVRSKKEIVCNRSLEFDLVRFTWNVDNFSFYRDSRGVLYDVLESPHFQTDDGQYDWVLRLIVHPRPDRPGDELCRDSVQIFLHLHSAPRETAHLKCQFVFVRYVGSAKEDVTYQISRFREFRRGETWGFRRFIQRSTLFEAKNGFVQNDRLTVKINLDIIRGTRDEIQRVGARPLLPTIPLGLHSGIAPLFQSREHADVTLVCKDGQLVLAHKTVLVSRSPVFSAMLSHDLTEKRTSTIEMQDVPKDVLEAFLCMLYTGSSPHQEEHAASLLVLGEKYQVVDIKNKALEILRKKLCPDNVADLLSLADLHNAPELKDELIDYIIRQWEKVRETESWKELRTAYPILMEQILDRMQSQSNKRSRNHSQSLLLP